MRISIITQPCSDRRLRGRSARPGRAAPRRRGMKPAPPRTIRGSRSSRRRRSADVEAMKEHTQQMVDSIFSFGELGFHETETHRYVVDILKKNGFTVQEGVAGIPTAFMATLGIGQAGDRARQRHRRHSRSRRRSRASRYHDPLVEGAPGHGEGHNSGVPLNITAAIAVKKIMEREKLPGTLRIWPGTAEELVGHQGVFHSRRAVQGRRRGALQPCGQRPGTCRGATRRAPGWSRSSTRSSARRRTPPARRGAAAARSTPSS